VWRKEDLHATGRVGKERLAGAGESVGLAIAYSCITSWIARTFRLGMLLQCWSSPDLYRGSH